MVKRQAWRRALVLVGLLTFGQEVDRLVEVLGYEEAGIVVEGRRFVCERVEVLEAGGLKLAWCREHGPERGRWITPSEPR